jgi:hypothetical protein
MAQRDSFDYFHVPQILTKLHSATLLTDENRQLLLDNKENAIPIFNALQLISSRALTHDYYSFIMLKPQYAVELTEGRRELLTAGLFNDENRKTLIQYAPYASPLGSTLGALNGAGIYTPENRSFLINNIQFLGSIDRILQRLQWGRILTRENFITLIKNWEFKHEILQALNLIPIFELNQEVFNRMIQKIHKDALEKKMTFLMGTHPRQKTESHLRFLVDDVMYDKNLLGLIFDFLPSNKESKSQPAQVNQNGQEWERARIPNENWYRAAKISSCILIGGTAGYLGSSAHLAAANNSTIVWGMNAGLFIGVCTIGGIGLLLLIGYLLNRYITNRPGFFSSRGLHDEINEERNDNIYGHAF